MGVHFAPHFFNFVPGGFAHRRATSVFLVLTSKEERRLRVFENRVLRSIFGPKRDEVTGNGENYIMRS
jgi:hypothetical protein